MFDYLEVVLSWFFWISFILQLPVIVFFLICFNRTKIYRFLLLEKKNLLFLFLFWVLYFFLLMFEPAQPKSGKNPWLGFCGNLARFKNSG